MTPPDIQWKKWKKKGLHSMKKINALFWQLSNENEILTPNWKANRSTRRTANTTPTCSLWPSYYQSTWSLWSVEVDKICSDQCCIMSSSNVPAIDQLSRTSISDLPTIDQRSRTVISVVPAVNQWSCHRECGPGGNLIRGDWIPQEIWSMGINYPDTSCWIICSGLGSSILSQFHYKSL